MIEGTKTLLRAVDPADAERVQRWVNEAGGLFAGPAGVPGLYSRRFHEGWLAQVGTNRDPGQRVFMVDTADRRPIGLVQVYDIEWVHRRCKVWLLIGEADYRERGYEEDVLRLLSRYLFHRLNLNRVELWVPATGTGMIQAARAAGFTEEARLTEAMFLDGQYVDLVCLRLLARDFLAPPVASGVAADPSQR